MGWMPGKQGKLPEDSADGLLTSASKPLARSEDLVIEELGEEVLVYDTVVDRAHSLSAAATRVWRACDGKSSVESLSSRLGMDEETVTQALVELDDCRLLTDVQTHAPGMTRRAVALKAAKFSAAAA